nr:MBL fold metallo-hydrolase [Butyricicoccus sp. AF22-28AC]
MTNFLSEASYRENPAVIADLSNLSVHKKGEKGNLLWNDPNFGINVNWQYPTDGTAPTRKKNLTFKATTDVDSVEIVPTTASSGATVTVNGTTVASGKAYEGKLTGNRTTFTIKVTAKNGSDTKTYTVIVTKQGSKQVSAPYTYTDYDNYTDPFYPDTPGTFTVTQYMALFSDTEGAQIKYTVDGSDPKTSETAKVFDQTKYKVESGVGGAEVKELITIGADTDSWDGKAKQTKVELKAYASKSGMEDSDVVTFNYTIDRMSKMEHKSRLMYDMDSMKVWSVIDYDSDKMYLIKGSKGALLIDAGMASAGANNLYEYCKQLAGTDNIDVYISHGHPDHTTQLGDFVQASRKVYINEKDIPMALKYVNDKTVTAGDFTCISEGYQFDLGGVVLDNYDIPGHTPGCMMLLDKAHNVLYSSDQLGCNRRSVADSLTLVNNDVRVLLSSLRIFRDKVTALEEAGEIDLDKLVVWSGHDDYEIHDLLGHLDTLITAAQNIVDYGPETAMRTSVRNTGGSDGASFAGDRYANGGTGHFICMNGSKANVLAGEDYTAVDELDKKYRSDYSGGMSGASRAVQGVCVRALAMSGDTLFRFFERFDQLV